MGGVIVYIRYAVFSNVTEKTYFGRPGGTMERGFLSILVCYSTE
jgi:hypothetical protein